MTPHLHLREVARANRTIALTLVWSAAVACVVAACAFDVSRWLHAW